MDVFDAVKCRYSCRKYLDKPIEREKLEKILESARLAPSARNFQDWRFVVITNKDLRTRLSEAANNQQMVAEAPVLIVACSNSDYVMRCGQAIAPIDVSIALEHIALQAVEEGLATCWIGSFFPDKVRPLLGIPKDIQIIELMVIGYPVDKQPKTNRKPIEEIICFEKWQF